MALEIDQSSPRKENDDASPQSPKEMPKKSTAATPLPFQQMIPMAFVLVNESLCQMVLLPFVGLLVARLKNLPVEEAGYFSGVMVGVFMLGQVVSGRIWGWASDEYGRRFPLISGLLASGVMSLLFSVSTSIWLCAIFRCLHGLCNGNTLVAKTMMADITDRTNQASGFAFVSFCYGIGLLLGPVIGGVLYNPTDENSAVHWMYLNPDGAFGVYPALLPCLIIFIFNMIGVFACTFYVKETNANAKPLPGFLRLIYPCLWVETGMFLAPPLATELCDNAVEDDADSLPNLSITFPIGVLSLGEPIYEDTRQLDQIMLEQLQQVELRSTDCTANDETSGSSEVAGNVEAAHRSKENCNSPREGIESVENLMEVPMGDDNFAEVPVEPTIYRTFGYKQAFRLDVTRFMLITYMILSAADMAAGELLPLWAISPKDKGGLEFKSDLVGVLVFANAVPCIVSNLLFSKACERYLNKMGLFRLGVGVAGFGVFLMPHAFYLPNTALRITTVVIATSIRQFFCSWSYGLVTMLTARSAPPGHVGSLMGINQSCGCLARGLTPFLFDPLFAWSISGNHLYPFNHVFGFYLSALAFWYCWGRAYTVRADINGTLSMVPSELVARIKEWVIRVKKSGRSREVVIIND